MNEIQSHRNSILRNIASSFIEKANSVVEIFSRENVLKYSSDLQKSFIADEITLEEFEKAIKDLTGLAQKRIIDKNGHAKIVYVRVNTDEHGKQTMQDFDKDDVVSFTKDGKEYSGKISSLKYSDKTDKLGTAMVDVEGRKISVSLAKLSKKEGKKEESSSGNYNVGDDYNFTNAHGISSKAKITYAGKIGEDGKQSITYKTRTGEVGQTRATKSEGKKEEPKKESPIKGTANSERIKKLVTSVEDNKFLMDETNKELKRSGGETFTSKDHEKATETALNALERKKEAKTGGDTKEKSSGSAIKSRYGDITLGKEIKGVTSARSYKPGTLVVEYHDKPEVYGEHYSISIIIGKTPDTNKFHEDGVEYIPIKSYGFEDKTGESEVHHGKAFIPKEGGKKIVAYEPTAETEHLLSLYKKEGKLKLSSVKKSLKEQNKKP